LTPVLEGVKTQVGYLGGFRVIVDAKNTALIVGFIIV
jgi:hypothetical protein